MADSKLQIIINARDEAQAKLRSLSKELKAVGQDLGNLGRGMSVGVTLPIVGLGAAIIKMASDATESENLFEVAMKGMAASAREWSDQMSQSLGLNAYEVRRNVGMFNSMFRAMELGEQSSLGMSESLTKLAYDLASFYNLPTDEAFQKLRSGIMGETEPLRALGIVIDDTTVKTWAMNKGLIQQEQEMSQAQKVMARYQLIMERTSDAQGDLARTADSPANAFRRMQSQLQAVAITAGNEFLPAVSTALSWINNEGIPAVRAGLETFKTAWGEMGDEAKRNVLITAGLFVAGGPLLIALSYAFRAVVAVGAAFRRLRLVAVAEIAALLIAANAAGKALHVMLNYRGGPIPSMTDLLAAATRDVTGFFTGWVDAAVKAAGGFETLEDALGPMRQTYQDMFAQVQATTGATEAQTPVVRLNAQEWNNVASTVGAAGRKHIKSAEDIAAAARHLIASSSQLVDYLISIDPAAQAAASGLATLKAQMVGARDQQEAMSESIRQAQDVLRSMQERVGQLSEALSDARARLQDLANVRLTGMGEADDKMFQVEQQIKRLKLQAMGVDISGLMPTDPETLKFLGTLPKSVEELEKMLEIMRLQRSVRFDEQLRALAEAARGREKEMSFDEALKAIAATKNEIAGLENQLRGAQDATKGQERYIRSLEEASRTLSKAVQQMQEDLQIQEEKQRLVNEALKTAFQWFADDRQKMIELGGEAVTQASLVDEETRKLLLATSEYAKSEAAEAIAAISAALDAYRTARAEMALGLYPGTGGGGIEPGGESGIPEMARGGIVTRRTLAWLGERGPEAVVPLGRGGLGRTAPVVINITGNTMLADQRSVARELARIIQPELDQIVRGRT